MNDLNNPENKNNIIYQIEEKIKLINQNKNIKNEQNKNKNKIFQLNLINYFLIKIKKEENLKNENLNEIFENDFSFKLFINLIEKNIFANEINYLISNDKIFDLFEIIKNIYEYQNFLYFKELINFLYENYDNIIIEILK